MSSLSASLLWVAFWSVMKMLGVIATGFGLALLLAALERRESPLLVSQGALLGSRGALRAKGLSLMFVDAIKLSFKADHVPPGGYRALFAIAPVWSLACALCLGATLPLAAPLCFGQSLQVVPSATCLDVVPMQVIATDDDLLLFVVVSMLSVFGTAMAGWSSRSKWALFSSLRHIFQSASYGVPVGLGLLSLSVLTGTLDPAALVAGQGGWPWQWGVWGVPEFCVFLVIWTALVVGAPRTPFSLDDGRSEVIGALAEYSGMRAGLFRLAELVRSVFAAGLVVTVFFGGWRFPGFSALESQLPNVLVVFLSWLAFSSKVAVACAIQQVARGSVVRPRPDQVLDLVWRRLVPLGVLTLVLSVAWRVLLSRSAVL